MMDLVEEVEAFCLEKVSMRKIFGDGIILEGNNPIELLLAGDLIKCSVPFETLQAFWADYDRANSIC